MQKCFHELYETYSNSIYRYLLVLTHDKDISEEITQETFYQAFKNIKSFQGKCSIYTWLCAIAKNRLKAYYTKNAKYTYDIKLEDIEQVTSDIDVSPLYEALSTLKSPYREIYSFMFLMAIRLKKSRRNTTNPKALRKLRFYEPKKC
ncbi:RNA polymerase sigma factor [Amedibacillus dolichus]|uniref:RNA polymerase sigma factor n=1 Tax=Amedibacillus dolichus TaxID=31971 RepID=UPI0015FA81E7|nr:sigma-70 family RNA polymerase sigma factor [Amedibacillus dolichus]